MHINYVLKTFKVNNRAQKTLRRSKGSFKGNVRKLGSGHSVLKLLEPLVSLSKMTCIQIKNIFANQFAIVCIQHALVCKKLTSYDTFYPINGMSIGKLQQ